MTPLSCIKERNSASVPAVGVIFLLVLATATTRAAPATYEIDPNHTHPSFEVDHQGMSMWRGLFRKTLGTVTLDEAAGTGTVDIIIDVASVDFGNDRLSDAAANSTALPIILVPYGTNERCASTREWS
jgi:polyisoprenoid-binding protein YceI